ncbi:MAG TPA: alternative ribosome rescue aminoacyl-tRNA hydrolase ArfB [Candidatus Limnocylindrales bacterium]|nr:alternative ribosome rescue aminoacyl-tRNA hydrolase ArfB [Candidatus Limnocylindrales bacterium]
MAEDLKVTGALVIPASELSERFSRSSGPGGQGVNTADSRVELTFDLSRLPEPLRARAIERLGRESVTVVASEHRAQLANRQAARTRLVALLREAIAPPGPKRKPTKPSRAAKERRLEHKRRRSLAKQARRLPDG